MAGPPPIPERFGSPPPPGLQPPPGSGAGLRVFALLMVAVLVGAGSWYARDLQARARAVTAAQASASARTREERERLTEQVAELEKSVARLKARADAGAREDAVVVGGGLDAAQVRVVAAKLAASGKRCFERESTSEPASEGRVEVAITIEPDGSVSRVEATPSGHLSPGIVACIKNIVSSARFPAASKSTAVAFAVRVPARAGNERLRRPSFTIE